MRGWRDWLDLLRHRGEPPQVQRARLDPLPPAYAARFDPGRVSLTEVVPDDAPVWSALHQGLLQADEGSRRALVVTSHHAERLIPLCEAVATRAAERRLALTLVPADARWRQPTDLLSAIASALALDPAPTRVEALIDHLNAGPSQVLMLPALQQAVLRVPGTAAMLTTLMRLILGTRGRIGWCLAVQATAWARWQRWVGLDGAIDEVVALEGLDDATLAEGLWQRHQAGDRPLQIALEVGGRAREPRRVDGPEHEALRDWVRAARSLSGGDPGRLLAHWRQAAGLDPATGAIELRAPAAPQWPAFGPLPARQRYALIEVMAHDGLQLPELAELFVCTVDDMVKDMARLVAAGLLERTATGYRPPQPWSARLARQLSALQALE